MFKLFTQNSLLEQVYYLQFKAGDKYIFVIKIYFAFFLRFLFIRYIREKVYF